MKTYKKQGYNLTEANKPEIIYFNAANMKTIKGNKPITVEFIKQASSQGEVVFVPMYWSERLKKYVTIPDSSENKNFNFDFGALAHGSLLTEQNSKFNEKTWEAWVDQELKKFAHPSYEILATHKMGKKLYSVVVPYHNDNRRVQNHFLRLSKDEQSPVGSIFTRSGDSVQIYCREELV